MTTRRKNKNSELVVLIRQNLCWHMARVKFFEKFICALIKVQTVCFSRLAEGFQSKAKVGSRQRRIQRFFADFDICQDLIASLIFGLLSCKAPYRL
jgi:hypothetical protein